MLLDLSCTCKEFCEFIQKGSDAGIKPDFNLEGRDKYSGFGIAAELPTFGEFTETSEEIIEDDPEPGEDGI